MAAAPSPMGREGAGSPHPTQIGPYEILDTLGEGGMGTVYLARQHVPVQRRVALKLIKLGMDSKAVVARFEQERQALALMAHDGIAKVYDCGTSERGQPYFVMELVKGMPLTTFCEQGRLSLPQRLLLMRQVCAAVTHAHQKGVVHRDLKPGNVLVSTADGRLQVKIIDFGLAKSLGQDHVEATLLTAIGQVVGTPEYMAPEQADPSNADIDTRADIYSLGVMLYEVLVGSLPFPAADLRRKGLQEMQRVLREEDPPKPSTKLSSTPHGSAVIAEARRMSPGALQRALKNDLDWVVLKAMEKDRNRRYETANALSLDLQRFLDHEPLVAGPPGPGYRLRKLLRRYRGQVLAASAVLATAILAAVVAADAAITASEWAAANAQLAQGEAARAAAATAAQEAAVRESQRADEQASELDARVREFDQLAAVVSYERVLAGQAELYPAWPHHIAAMERWLEQDAGELLAMRPEIQRTVDDLEDRALPATAAERAPDERRTFRFQLESEQFLHDTLAELLGMLDSLASKKVEVERRLLWAKQVEGLSRAHPGTRHSWAAVRAAVASNPRYAGQGIELRDQDVTGLVPIGENPVTKLWEFYDLRSAWDGQADPRTIAIPSHAPDGSIPVTGDTGIVFVLLPGGAFPMGAPQQDGRGPDLAPTTDPGEARQQVELAPFLLARHELTEGQWARLWDGDPDLGLPIHHEAGGDFAGPANTWAHPVQQVDWVLCDTLLAHHGLALPTEAQWEYGCRGGTSTPWSGPRGELQGRANVADAAWQRTAPAWIRAVWSDGHAVPAPVGSSAGNAFGLHDMHGNVWEWCRDELGGDPGPARAGDGLRRGDGPARFCARGGDGATRGMDRVLLAPSVRLPHLGVRAARLLRR